MIGIQILIDLGQNGSSLSVNKWLFLRLTAINKQSNNDNLRKSVMMQYPNQKKNSAQRIIKAKP